MLRRRVVGYTVLVGIALGLAGATQGQAACSVTPAGNQGVNMRGGPGTNYPRADVLSVGNLAEVTGQRQGSDGQRWWRTFSGGWVRSDVARASGPGCESVPVVQPPPDYCLRRETLSKRPDLGPDERRLGTERFVVHYTTKGEHATTEAYAQAAAEALEESFSIQIDRMGWPLPPPDCGEGGDERFDLYLLNLEGVFGYAQSEVQVGDNPFTPQVEQYASTSHLVVENDMEGYSDDPLGAMRATIAHELHHNIQFSFDFGDAYGGPAEWGAVWMETQVYPDEEDAVGYSYMLTRHPDLCLGWQTNDENEPLRTRIYGEWLIQDSLARDFGPEDLHRVLWRNIADYEGFDVMLASANQWGMDIIDIRARAAIRNLLVDHTLPLRWLEPVYVERIITEAGNYPIYRDGVQELGVDYLLIPFTDGSYEFRLNDAQMTMFLVGLDRVNSRASVFRLGTQASVDLRPFSESYLIVLNTRTPRDQYSCRFTDWQVTVSETSTSQVARPEFDWDMSNYRTAMQWAPVEVWRGYLRLYKDVFAHYVMVYPGEMLNVAATPVDDPSLDLLIVIYDEAGNELASEDDTDGLNPRLSWTNTSDTALEVRVTITGAVSNIRGEFEAVVAIDQEAVAANRTFPR
ncbi:MAG: SH3 domain-containing protein [Anaerolineae bacterium]|nr:SH3 domain-containing protein [Anaerolineae bacterium]MDW8173930.1 hypothetical protein [Anaerolineae bacterium]